MSGVLTATETGAGPPLVLINGYGGARADWDPAFIAGLARASAVIAPDNRGIGDSPGLEDGELTAAGMAADVIALMDDRGIEAAAVAGWSMGGMVAQEVAAQAPDRVSHLVLLSTNGGGRGAVPADPSAYARLTDHSGTPREQATRLIGLLFPPDVAARFDAEFGKIVADARAAMTERTLETLTAQEGLMAAWRREDSAERLGRITAPVLIAAGALDEVIPPENSRILADALQDSWLARFPGCGHGFMAQEPERLAALINAFLGR